MKSIVPVFATLSFLLISLLNFVSAQDSAPRFLHETASASVHQDNAAENYYRVANVPMRQDEDRTQDSPSDQRMRDGLVDVEGDLTPGKRQKPEFGPWPRTGIRSVDLDIRDASSVVPEDRSGQLVNNSSNSWTELAPAPKVFAWVAPNIRYRPLYFEDVALERYGQTARPYRQSVLSGVHFFTSAALLPIQARQKHPYSCDYPLGFCRPGDTVDYTIQRFLNR